MSTLTRKIRQHDMETYQRADDFIEDAYKVGMTTATADPFFRLKTLKVHWSDSWLIFYPKDRDAFGVDAYDYEGMELRKNSLFVYTRQQDYRITL